MAIDPYLFRLKTYWSNVARGALAAHRARIAFCRSHLLSAGRKEWGLFRIGRPRRGDGKGSARQEVETGGLFRRFYGSDGCQGGLGRGRSGRQATRAHEVKRAVDVGIFHSDPRGSITAHGMSGKAATPAIGQGAVVRVDMGDQIAGNKALSVTGRDRTGIHRTVF